MHVFPNIVRRVPTRSRNELIDVTDLVAAAVKEMGLVDGIVTVFVPHTTAGVTINENADPDVKHDLLKKLAELVPHRESYYRHGEGNSDSHLKTAWMGNSAQVIVEAGALLLGTWQGIYFCEFDGPRNREIWIKGMGAAASHSRAFWIPRSDFRQAMIALSNAVPLSLAGEEIEDLMRGLEDDDRYDQSKVVLEHHGSPDVVIQLHEDECGGVFIHFLAPVLEFQRAKAVLTKFNPLNGQSS